MSISFHRERPGKRRTRPDRRLRYLGSRNCGQRCPESAIAPLWA